MTMPKRYQLSGFRHDPEASITWYHFGEPAGRGEKLNPPTLIWPHFGESGAPGLVLGAVYVQQGNEWVREDA